MTPTEEQIEALAGALEEWEWMIEREEVAEILAALDGWMLVRTGTEGQRREALDLVERQHVEITRLRKIEEAEAQCSGYYIGHECGCTCHQLRAALAALETAP